MTTARAHAARRFWRTICLLWLLFILGGAFFRLPYLRSPRRDAAWALSAGVVALAWVGAALWSGVVQLGYRGIGARTIARAESARAYWSHLAAGAVTGVALIALGVIRLTRRA